MNNKKVTKHTRAGKAGKWICCPHCKAAHIVYHFAWFALQCNGCGEMAEKTNWLLDEV